MYIEDIDYCRRVKAEGWPVIYYPAARVIHHHLGSAPADYSVTVMRVIEALLYYFNKYDQETNYLAKFVRLHLILQLVRYTLVYPFSKKGKELRLAYLKALRETKKLFHENTTGQ